MIVLFKLHFSVYTFGFTYRYVSYIIHDIPLEYKSQFLGTIPANTSSMAYFTALLAAETFFPMKDGLHDATPRQSTRGKERGAWRGESMGSASFAMETLDLD